MTDRLHHVAAPDAQADSDAQADPDGPVEVLRRWAGSGAIWRVVARTAAGLEIVLLTCTGDEEMGRLTSSDPDLLAYVGDRRGSED
ncbi:MAG TPA: hypothetical protein VHN80_04720 [Kineosporiaceae bacterium]|jgi:hypothetical protein|nr:hypothetical protein [Kineosporiaceae bacterium]